MKGYSLFSPSFPFLFEEEMFQEISLKTHQVLGPVAWSDQAVSPDLNEKMK
jgi:hypothetical protein